MSLLNDALRDAEQRQTRPQVTGTYTGQPAVQPADTSKTPLIIGLLAILVLIGGAGTWWLLSDDVVLPVAETAGSSALVAPEPAAPAASPEPTPLNPFPNSRRQRRTSLKCRWQKLNLNLNPRCQLSQ